MIAPALGRILLAPARHIHRRPTALVAGGKRVAANVAEAEGGDARTLRRRHRDLFLGRLDQAVGGDESLPRTNVTNVGINPHLFLEKSKTAVLRRHPKMITTVGEVFLSRQRGSAEILIVARVQIPEVVVAALVVLHPHHHRRSLGTHVRTNQRDVAETNAVDHHHIRLHPLGRHLVHGRHHQRRSTPKVMIRRAGRRVAGVGGDLILKVMVRVQEEDERGTSLSSCIPPL